jgi:hypothetical protein
MLRKSFHTNAKSGSKIGVVHYVADGHSGPLARAGTVVLNKHSFFRVSDVAETTPGACRWKGAVSTLPDDIEGFVEVKGNEGWMQFLPLQTK